MKKYLIAPDKFKGTLSAQEVCDSLSQGILSTKPTAKITACPLADGGDGTFQLLFQHLGGKSHHVKALDALGRPKKAEIAYNRKTKTAVLETAKVIGLAGLAPEEIDCMKTSSYGLGLILSEIAKLGAEKIIICLGGTANMDAGIGMAEALGFDFYDENQELFRVKPETIGKINTITQPEENLLDKIEIICLCDVLNPLYGKLGAPYSFAKQKGASDSEIEILEQNFQRLGKTLKEKYHCDAVKLTGGGAAGGLGFAFRYFLNAKLVRGIDYILELLNFDDLVKQADLIITGEGKIDAQSIQGKVLSGVLKNAQKYGKPVIAVCGILDIDAETAQKWGLSKVIPYAVPPLSQPLPIGQKTKLGLEIIGRRLGRI